MLGKHWLFRPMPTFSKTRPDFEQDFLGGKVDPVQPQAPLEDAGGV